MPFLSKPLSPWANLGEPNELLDDPTLVYPYVPIGDQAELERCVQLRDYLICSHPRSFKSAEQLCRSQGGDLATFDTLEQHDEFGTELWRLYQRSIWIGLSYRQSEGGFVWQGEQSLSFDRWNEGQPSGRLGEECVSLNYIDQLSGYGQWNHWTTAYCDYPLGFVCRLP